MTLGFDQPLYVLPFDHRGSFETGMFGWKGVVNLAQTTVIEFTKRIVYDGFKAAIAAGVPKERACILADEQFSSPILHDASAQGYMIAYPVEKTGQDEFDFEQGENFANHIEEFQPTFCKVLLRYNPEGNRALNRRQTERLRRLSDFLHSQTRSRLMCELLIPAEKAQFEKVKGDKEAYESAIRPQLTVQTLKELQEAHVEPDVWMVERLDRREDCERIVAAARHGGRDRVGCVALCREEDDKNAREWLAMAATVPGFIGFALGHSFWESLFGWRAWSVTREAAVEQIAQGYREFVNIFEKERGK